MIFISILVALILDRLLPQFHQLRRFDWLQSYVDWLNDVLSISRLPVWLTLMVILFPLLIGLHFVQGLFSHVLFGLFELAFSVAVLYFCLGPKDLDQQVDDYIDALKSNDDSLRTQAASALSNDNTATGLSDQVAQTVKSIFTLAHRRLFACVFWFLMLGPVGAVLYRVVDQSRFIRVDAQNAGPLSKTLDLLLAFLEWLPARITVGCFMLSGHFEAAFSAYRQAANELVDWGETNQGILVASGQAAIQYQTVNSESDAVEQVKKARGLVLRAMVVWLLFCLLVFWL